MAHFDKLTGLFWSENGDEDDSEGLFVPDAQDISYPMALLHGFLLWLEKLIGARTPAADIDSFINAHAEHEDFQCHILRIDNGPFLVRIIIGARCGRCGISCGELLDNLPTFVAPASSPGAGKAKESRLVKQKRRR